MGVVKCYGVLHNCEVYMMGELPNWELVQKELDRLKIKPSEVLGWLLFDDYILVKVNVRGDVQKLTVPK